MFYKKEKSIIYLIRYAPLILIIILAFLTTYIMKKSNEQHLSSEIILTTNFYKEFHNKELKEEISKTYNYIEESDKSSKEKLKEYIKERVYEAHAIATKIYEDNKSIKNKKEILILIKSALGSIIYNEGRGYFFITDINGNLLLQPLNKSIENKNISQTEDVNGYKFVTTISQTIKNKTEKFDTYFWFKNEKDHMAYEKMSFYKYFEPLELAIGSGEYIADFENEVKQNVINYINKANTFDNNYIFLINFEGEILVHKNKDIIGMNYLKSKERKNYLYSEKIIEIAKNGEDFMTYYNNTLNGTPYKKISYIKGYKKWNWAFGIGYSDESLVKNIAKVKKRLEEKNQENFEKILLVTAVITSILLIISILISKYLENIFSKYQQRIHEEEKEFRNLFEYTNIGLAICDDNGKFINVNSKFVQMLGYKNNNELLDKRWNDISKEESTDSEDKHFSDLINQKINTYSIEKLYTKEDGSHIDTFITANLLQENKEVKNILFSIIDVSEIKTKDKLLFQQSKLASMGEMIANIAHQWRQPLSLISTASSGMKMQKEFDLLTDENFNNTLDSITNATQYLSQTIDNFKNFFSPREKKEIFNLNEPIHKMLTLVSSDLKEKNIEVIENINTIEIVSYENDLIQVFINIINNAKDALTNAEDNFIFIDAKLSGKKNTNLIITIRDNAGGIPEEVIGKIFEPYFTTKYKSNGTGIGLYMVMEIIQKHMNGSISAENITYEYKGKSYIGAEFSINIPIK